jgi:hypothetical protein
MPKISDVAAWLRDIGNQQYEEVFRRNRVDTDMLLSLTPEDLREIGVTSVTDRRKLISAIDKAYSS